VRWKISDDSQLVRYFDGENVWKKHWKEIGDETADVIDHQGLPLTLPVWEVSFSTGNKRFAAGEVSNSVWIFALLQS
jgi:hypothetical protein